MVADSSIELVAALKQFDPPLHSDNISIIMEEKFYNEDSDYSGDRRENEKQ
jgi:hypothetical protein